MATKVSGYVYNPGQTPARQWKKEIVASDSAYRHAREEGMLKENLQDDSTFKGRLRGTAKDAEINVADVVGHYRLAANAWRFTLADGRTGTTYDVTFPRKVINAGS